MLNMEQLSCTAREGQKNTAREGQKKLGKDRKAFSASLAAAFLAEKAREGQKNNSETG